METIRVVAAVIKATNKNGDPMIFATQRGYGDFFKIKTQNALIKSKISVTLLPNQK